MSHLCPLQVSQELVAQPFACEEKRCSLQTKVPGYFLWSYSFTRKMFQTMEFLSFSFCLSASMMCFYQVILFSRNVSCHFYHVLLRTRRGHSPSRPGGPRCAPSTRPGTSAMVRVEPSMKSTFVVEFKPPFLLTPQQPNNQKNKKDLMFFFFRRFNLGLLTPNLNQKTKKRKHFIFHSFPPFWGASLPFPPSPFPLHLPPFPRRAPPS